MSEGSGWQPLLTGSLADKARETVLAIADVLREPPVSTPPEGMEQEAVPAYHLGLCTGRAGLAVFFAYLSEAGLLPDAEELAWKFLDDAEEGVATEWMGASLCEGFTGVGWVHAHLHQHLCAEPDRGALKTLDEAVIELLKEWPWKNQFELLYGLTGIGVYALERLPRARARTMLSLIVTRLEEMAQHSNEGITWIAPSNDGSPPGEFNLGMAHGIPGAVALLARTVAARVERKRAFALLRESVRWLRVQRLTPELGGGFPASVSPGASPVAARVAWCYGDPGVVAALLAAARVLDQPDLEQEAIDLALSAADRPPSESLIADAGICHGAAGLGHLYNRFFQMTGHPVLGAAARNFFAQAIEFRRPGTGIAGYAPAPAPGSADTSGIDQNDPGLLTGAAGIGLALLAATTTVPPAWDRLLLVDLPMAGRAGRSHAQPKLELNWRNR